MAISRLMLKPYVEAIRPHGRVSWRLAYLIGIPIGIAGVALFAYYMKRKSGYVKSEPAPKTPLDTAISLKNKGNKLFKGGRYLQAIDAYNEGIELCPRDAIHELAFLYQNRAAAKENQHQYEEAVEDCSAALALKPKYLKALSRRARLYKALSKVDDWLFDATACCILEEFENPRSLESLAEAMKTIGEQKAKIERVNLSYELPSASYIKNYFSTFSWDPFTMDSELDITSSTDPVTNGLVEGVVVDSSDIKHRIQNGLLPNSTSSNELVQSAFDQFNLALQSRIDEDYEQSLHYAKNSVELFEKFLSDPASLEHTTLRGPEVMMDGDEPATPTTDTSKNDEEVNRKSKPDKFISLVKDAYTKALLLLATYEGITGLSESAKEHFQLINSNNSGASPRVQANALIKLACLSMSVEQNIAACLYDFQRAQSLYPKCPDVHFHRGQIFLVADQLDEALHDFTTAIELKPEFPPAQAQRIFTLHRIAMKSDNMEEVSLRVEELEKLAKKYPNCQETCSLLGQVLSDCGRYEESDKAFAKLVTLCPGSGMAYAYRGLLQMKWKQDRTAVQELLAHGAEVDPKCELICELLGQLAVDNADFAGALEHFGAAIKHARTEQDLAHLISLREGVIAQTKVCEQYNISIAEAMSSLHRRQALFLAGQRSM